MPEIGAGYATVGKARRSMINRDKKTNMWENIISDIGSAGIFAAGAISFGGDFFEWKARKDAKDLAQKRHDDMMKRMIS